MKLKDKKDIMVSVLKHPAEVLYKDEELVVLIPNGMESLCHHLDGATGFDKTKINILKNDDIKYVVRTRKDQRFLISDAVDGWQGSKLRFEFMYASQEHVIKEYPSLMKAFGDIAKEKSFLPLIENQTDEDIRAALKIQPANIKWVRDLTQKQKIKWIKFFPAIFEHIVQNPELVKFAIENTDISLGKVSSTYCSAGVCKTSIRKNPLNIQFVPEQHKTKELILSAIKQDPNALRYISHPTFDLYIAAAKSGKDGWKLIPEALKKKVRKAL